MISLKAATLHLMGQSEPDSCEPISSKSLRYCRKIWHPVNMGHVILIAARLADKNAMMARVHTAMHDIIRQPFLAILSDHRLKADRDAVGLTLVAPILYYHLFLADQKQINVDRFLFGLG